MFISGANALVLSGIAKNGDGSTKLMGYAEAIEYCQDSKNVKQPAHLPSARELAKLAARNGANGIVKSCKPGLDCERFNLLNSNNAEDAFNYVTNGYKQSDSAAGVWLWSNSRQRSTSHWHLGENDSKWAVVLSTDTARLGYVNIERAYGGAVRCVSGR